jgi:hypothetical protein
LKQGSPETRVGGVALGSLILMSIARTRHNAYAWWGLAAIYLALVVHLALYSGTEGRCESTACHLLAAGQLLTCLIVLCVALMPGLRSAAALALGRIPAAAYLSTVAGILLVFGLLMRPEWVYVHMALALCGLAALLYVTVYGGVLPRIRRSTLIMGVVALVFGVLALRVLTLSASPRLHAIDEPWTLGWVVSYLKTGQPSDWIMGSLSGSPYYSLPRYYALVAAWSSVAGVGLWEGRLFSLLVTVLAAGFTTAAAWRLYNWRTAIFTLLALLASSLVVIGLRLRHDVGVTLAIAVSLYIYSYAAHGQRLSLDALAGFAAGIGMFAHYHAAGFAAALGIGLYLPSYVDRLRSRQWIPPAGFVAFAAGAAVAAMIVLSVQWLPDTAQASAYSPPRFPSDVPTFLDALAYHAEQVAQHSQLEFTLLVAACAAALIRRNRRDVSLAIALFLCYLALGILAGWKQGPYYSVPLTPIICLLIGRLFSSRRPQTPGRAALAVAGFCLITVQCGYALSGAITALRAGLPVHPVPPPAAAWVRQHVAHSQTILAEHIYFLWLTDYRFFSPLAPTTLPPDQRVSSMGTAEDILRAWSSFAPDIVIVDPQLAGSPILATLVDQGYLDDYDRVFPEEDVDESGARVYRRR